MADYSKVFSPSFGQNTFITKDIPGVTDKAPKLNLSNINFNKLNDIKFNPIAFDPSVNILEDAGWSFITAPEDISWDVNNQASRVDIFGTNNPPVIAGSRGMRDLTLGNSLVEGFVRGVTVEGKIAALEKLMNYKLNQTDGFVGVPVYQVTANDKVYGNGYFIIKDIKIQEKMRDIRGNATRAYVDVSLMEVPEYQVNSGRDLASQPASAAQAILPKDANATPAQQAANTKAAVNNSVDQNVNAGNKAGPNAPTSSAPRNQLTPTSLDQQQDIRRYQPTQPQG